ncbi:alpha-hydroxy acid oxidase [Kitasatospora sp. YST-16]|uniref:alpha-hydroxy acid oxidase n=1 Tax=Kitasatospora sp. YST-16 TaxID=2998080 RepID=UPI0022851CD1|nr:alpha-hydroxy acid oxidase [Kitasatospora sp. YST-16]WAL75551.1 alpha-hydroxy acid oxidase [Kitasatospora sp. YST-16]WNW41617.1 alpha-hydroxy acid oxidase [Streptomyces sp. Li-HN-5-13]
MDALEPADFERAARARLPAETWDFVQGGSGAERTLAANRAQFEQARLRPRTMVDVSTTDQRLTLLGSPLSTPIGIAPVAYHQLFHPEGETATARAAGRAGALMVAGIFASRTLESIAEAATGPLWLQLYWLRRRDALAALVERAEAAGFRALVLTVDAPRIGRRLRDARNGFAVPAHIRAVNLDPSLMAASHRADTGSSGIADHAKEQFDPTLTWADLAWLRERSSLPIVLKGILTAEDARLAAEHGVDAVVVSNHGGRQLDGALPTLSALPEVVAAVPPDLPVLLDGGVRTGTDVALAVALGARAVLIGRPILWGLAADGENGVARVLDLLKAELDDTLALLGRPRLADLDPTAVVR